MDGRDGPFCHPVRRTLCGVSGLTPWGQSADPATPLTEALLHKTSDTPVRSPDSLQAAAHICSRPFRLAVPQWCNRDTVSTSRSAVLATPNISDVLRTAAEEGIRAARKYLD
jgi:hypothetical protein